MNKDTIIKFVLISGMLVCGGYLIADSTLSNNRVQARIDKGAGGPLVRSMQMSDAEVSARQALGRFAEYKNHYRGDCTGITDLEVLFTKESDSLSDAEVKCLKQVMASPAPFTKITSRWFKGKHEPKIIKTVYYNPRKHGVGGMTVELPGDGSYSFTKCSGSYRQIWCDGNFSYIGCDGVHSKNMPMHGIKLMPLENPREYGKILINNQNNKVSLNINIPQQWADYADIVGNLTIDFYK